MSYSVENNAVTVSGFRGSAKLIIALPKNHMVSTRVIMVDFSQSSTAMIFLVYLCWFDVSRIK